jgi:hypothetical protein
MNQPFDYVNQILQGKKQLIVDEASERDYNPYLTNRSLSYHKDCLIFANEMNRRHFLDKKMQHDYLLHTIRSQKRQFAKWVKPEKQEHLEAVKMIYGFSNQKAREALKLISREDLEKLAKMCDTGGMVGK